MHIRTAVLPGSAERLTAAPFLAEWLAGDRKTPLSEPDSSDPLVQMRDQPLVGHVHRASSSSADRPYRLVPGITANAPSDARRIAVIYLTA